MIECIERPECRVRLKNGIAWLVDESKSPAAPEGNIPGGLGLAMWEAPFAANLRLVSASMTCLLTFWKAVLDIEVSYLENLQ